MGSAATFMLSSLAALRNGSGIKFNDLKFGASEASVLSFDPSRMNLRSAFPYSQGAAMRCRRLCHPEPILYGDGL